MVRIKASSIYESVLSIAIIAITIILASYIFLNVMSTQKSIAYYQTIEKVEQLKKECEEKQEFTNQTVKLKEYKIDQVVAFHNENENLIELNYNITKEDKKVKTLKYLVYKK